MAKCKVIKKDSVIDEIWREIWTKTSITDDCEPGVRKALSKYIPQPTTLEIELTQEEVERIKSNEYTLGPGISIETMSTIAQTLKESINN